MTDQDPRHIAYYQEQADWYSFCARLTYATSGDLNMVRSLQLVSAQYARWARQLMGVES